MISVRLLSFLVLSLAAIVSGGSFNQNSLSKFNDFVKTPQNLAKSTIQIQSGGRLIERHIAYLQEAGFQSILSVVYFPTNDTVYNGVAGDFPSTDYEGVVASSHGIKARYVVANFSVDSAKEVSSVMDSLPRPLYVHCHVGYMANLFTQLHLYQRNEITAADIYPNSLSMGYDYQNNSDVVNLINALSGRTDVTHPEIFEQNLAAGEMSYKSYYWTHRLGNNDMWYNAGQVLETHVNAIASAGYTTIISFRADREATARLSSEDSSGPVSNFEFSDEQGLYSVAKEASAFSTVGIDHVHLPLPSDDPFAWTKETYEKYLPQLRKIERDTKERISKNGKGAVLIHCASGYRSAAFVLTHLAKEQSLCTDWVLLKANQIGFNYHSSTATEHDNEIFNFVFSMLGC
jgi:protein tyrosine phosphatase (PTP) superfamily phosphohydrolase (DUF442 family)